MRVFLRVFDFNKQETRERTLKGSHTAAPLFVSFDEGFFKGRVLCAAPLFVSFDERSFEGVEKKRKEPLKEKGSTQKPTFFFFPFEAALTGKNP